MTITALTRRDALDGELITAVTYQRVSTREQAAKGGQREGFSIPAQRKANQRKAVDLGAEIVAEFSDPGYSARTINRPDLQRMLAYIKTHQVTYCIVHKVDRLARDRLVDLQIHSALIEAGVALVSVTESIDETPSGTLVHGVMSSIAEFYSKNLAAEVTKGLTQKIASGGTPGKAPIGYLNIRKQDEQGREYRTVEVDPERAPLIRWAFGAYAAGDTSVERVVADITARGLTTVPTPQRPSKPVTTSGFFKLLRNPYYIGQIRYNGAVHEGTHEAIVDVETWQRVQRLLDSRARDEVRFRKHEHHLKGLLYCATCKSRLQLTLARNKQGNRYAYYVCSGKTSKRTNCTRKAVPVGVAEELVAACYKRIGIDEATFTALAEQVDAAFDERLASQSQELAELMTTRKRLEAEREKLINAHFADAIDLETLKRHQDRIRAGLADIDRKLENDHEEQAGQRQYLGSALKALTYCASMYERSDDQAKRLANQTFFERIYIGEDEEPEAKLAKPFALLAPTETSHVGCSSKTTTVDLRSSFSNPRKPLGSLISRVLGGSRARKPRTGRTRIIDQRGTVRENSRQSQTRLSVSNRAELLDGYAAGVPVRELATQFNVHRGTVREIARQAGLAARQPELHDAIRQDAAQFYANGLTLAQVATQLGISNEAVRSAVIARGGTIRPGGRRRISP